MAGGLRGTLLGFGTGLAASTAAGVFFAGCDICSQYLEDEIEKQKMSNAQLTVEFPRPSAFLVLCGCGGGARWRVCCQAGIS